LGNVSRLFNVEIPHFGVEANSSLSVHKIPPLVPFLNEMNPLYTMPFILYEIRF